MFDRSRHLLSKIFRGPIVGERLQEDGRGMRTGYLIQYWSGYVRHIDAQTGKNTDVYADIHFKKHRWILVGTSATRTGETSDTPYNMRRAAAIHYVNRYLGNVMTVDDSLKSIAYRVREE